MVTPSKTLISRTCSRHYQTALGAPPPERVIAHANLYWTYQTAPGRKAGTIETRGQGPLCRERDRCLASRRARWLPEEESVGHALHTLDRQNLRLSR
jgi:hypothetical protein